MKWPKRIAAGLMAAAVVAGSVPVCPADVRAEEPGRAEPVTSGQAEPGGLSSSTREVQPDTPESEPEKPGKPESAMVIRTVEEFMEFARACTSERFSEGKTVSLEADLDLGGEAFSPVPVFCGTFAGNGHTIRGLSVRRSGTSLGLFRYLGKGALVENLKVEGELKPEGSRKKMGGIAGTNRGTIRGCTFSGTGEALEHLGGIAGINEESGMIENCVNQAVLTGNRRVGGIAGENAGTIQGCRNEGEINGASEGIDEDTGTMNTISVNREELPATVIIEKVNDVGGITGLSTGTIRQCSNSGKIGYEHTGYNIGGIVGRHNGILVLCENEGNVTGRKDVGGIAGQLEPFLTVEYGRDTFDKIHDQVDEISDTTDAMTRQLRDTTDASIGNLDRVDEIVKTIRDLTRDKKDVRRGKREEYEEKAGRQLDLIDEILAGTELDLGSRQAHRAAGSLRANIARARELLAQLGAGSGGEGIPLPEDFIFDEDAGVLGQLEYLYEVMKALQECAGDITSDAASMIDYGVEGVVDGVRDFEDDMESLRVASKEFLDLTRDYKDQLVEDVDGLDGDVTGQLDQLYEELDGLSDNLKSGKDRLRAQKDTLDGQLDEIQDILTDGKERVRSEIDKAKDDGESLFEDISESVTELNNGMIIGCSNRGAVFSDFQAGGVAGIIGLELDLDPEEDIQTYGDESFYRDRYALASVRECYNQGDVQAQQDYAGGIVGAARLGILASNQNYGDVTTVDGDYAGGIAGSSQSVISGSYTMCEVTGNDYTGGIAGKGRDLKDNCAMVSVVSEGGEWQGSIAGSREEEGEVNGNLYVDDGMGAVDGITFLGEAEGISYETLMEREGLPEEFASLTVTFLADDQMVEQIVCQYGQALSEERMPQVPEKEGFFHYWEDTDLSNIRKNYKVHAVYVPWTTTIASSRDPKPLLLAEASFYPETRLLVRESEGQAPNPLQAVAPTGHRIVKSLTYEVQPPEGASLPDAVILHVRAERADRVGILRDGAIELSEAVKDGDYLVFSAPSSGEIVLMKHSLPWQYLLAAAGMVIAVGGWQMAVRNGKNQKKKKGEEEEKRKDPSAQG